MLIDRRHHVVRVFHPAPEGLGLLGQVVVGEHHVGLVALVVVHHGRDRRCGLVQYSSIEPVERAGERGHDRVDGHPVGERALVGGDDVVAVGVGGLALLHVPHPVGLHVLRGHLGLVLHELRDGIANAAVVGATQALDDLVHLAPRDGERHLVVLSLAEDAITGAGQDHLGLIRAHRGHDDLRAVDPAAEGGGQLAAAFPQRRLGQPHHLGGIGVDAHEVGLEGRPVEWGDQQRVVLARLESVHGRLGALPGFLALGVHPLAQGAGGVQVRRLLEAEGGDAERADVVLPGERDHPAIAAGHVDDLAIHRQLFEISGWPLRLFRDWLARLEHPDRHRKRLRPDVRLQLPIRGLAVHH